VLHAEIGSQAKAAHLARLWTVGKLSRSASAAFGSGAMHFESQEALVAALREALASRAEGALRVLVKGSRSSAMDKVVSALLAGAGEGGHAA
jgi:UDP-N-acetylmuramoyl-tripeptide--D-alanyl-D-alanine ligase